MRLQPLVPVAAALRTPARAVARAIALYRAHLSGRGPLRRVRCTFERTESCSAYGLRIAAEQPALRSLALVATRIRRCGRLSLYRDRDHAAWLWHVEHETLTARELDAALERSHELASTRAAVLRANALVGCELGDAVRVAACRELLASLGETRPAGTPPEQILVRAAATCFVRPRRRRGVRVVATLVVTLIVTATLLSLGAHRAAALACLAGVASVTRAWWRCAREVSRVEGLLASGAFTPPGAAEERVA